MRPEEKVETAKSLPPTETGWQQPFFLMQGVCLGTFGAMPGHKPLEILLAELIPVSMKALACLFPAGAQDQSL